MSQFFPNMAGRPHDGPGYVCWCGDGCGGQWGGCGGGHGGHGCGKGGGCGGGCGGRWGRGGGCGRNVRDWWFDECFFVLGNVIDDTNIAPNCSCRCRCCICGGWCGADCKCVRCENVCIDNCDRGDCCCREPRGRICIHKVDANNRSMPLACAEFQLQDSHGMPCAIGITDANGNLCFSGLRNGTYYLTEINPPSGYQLNQDVTSITLTPFEHQVFLEIADTPVASNIGSIVVTARAANGLIMPLPDIRIQATNVSTGATYTATTDASGTARFFGLPFGTYSITALDTPAGYAPPGPIQVTVSAENPHPAIAIDFYPL